MIILDRRCYVDLEFYGAVMREYILFYYFIIKCTYLILHKEFSENTHIFNSNLKKILREKNKKKTDVQPALGSASELSIHGFPREVDSSTAPIFAESQPTKTTNKHKRPPTNKRIQKRHHHRR